LSWPSWLACSGWLTHISGHPSAAGQAQDSESTPARDRRDTDWTTQPTQTEWWGAGVVICLEWGANDLQLMPLPLHHLIDWVVVLRPTQHKTGHFGDVPQANLLAWYGTTKPSTTKAHIHQSKQMYYNTKWTQKLQLGLVASYDIRPGNGEGLCLFWHVINLSLTYLDTYPLTAPGPYGASHHLLLH